MLVNSVINIENVLSYIENRRNGDGGYNTVGIEPSSAVDTFFAVVTYNVLGSLPPENHHIVNFMTLMEKSRALDSLKGRYVFIKTLKLLGNKSDLSYQSAAILNFKNDRGGFGLGENIYIEIYSELESTFYAVESLKELGYKIDDAAIVSYVLSFRNGDGGYGGKGFSTLPTTFFALKILERLKQGEEIAKSREFLDSRDDLEKRGSTYIEDIYWLTESLAVLGEKPQKHNAIVDFVTACQRSDNHGFTRSANGGIADFEYTYYAVKVLKRLERC